MKKMPKNFVTISGWLAIPVTEYVRVYNEWNANSNLDSITEVQFYALAKRVADARNNFHGMGTDADFKKTMIGSHYPPLTDIINVHYAIRSFYLGIDNAK